LLRFRECRIQVQTEILAGQDFSLVKEYGEVGSAQKLIKELGVRLTKGSHEDAASDVSSIVLVIGSAMEMNLIAAAIQHAGSGWRSITTPCGRLSGQWKRAAFSSCTGPACA
jgi:hypothetical protein